MVPERMKELLGLLMIGDGALAFVEPRRHVLLWRRGPAAWQAMMDEFVERPGLTRWLGAAELALGFWLATRQMDRLEFDRPARRARPPLAFAESR
jgi:hypothetical protein